MNRRLIVRQRDIKDCGVCCLLSIIRYYNGDIPLEKLRLDTKTTIEGTSAYNIIYAAKKYGFVSKGEKLNKLSNNIPVPSIAHIVTKKGFNHFVVIYKVNKKYVYIMDPGKGYRKEKIEDFKKEWTNVILIFKPYKKIPLYTKENSLAKLFINILKSEKGLIKRIIISDILTTFISIMLSYYLQITNAYVEAGNKKIVILFIIIFLSLNLFKTLFDYNRNNISIHLSKNIDIKIIPEFIFHIFHLPLNAITSRTSGELLTRIQEINSIKNLFTRILISILLDSFLVIGTTYFLYSLSNQLFIILLITTTLYILIGLVSSKLIYERINDNIEAEVEFNSDLTEKIGAIESIRNLDYVNNSLADLDDKYIDYEKNTFEYNRFQNNLITIKNLVNNLGLFLITSYGLILISNNSLNLLSLITFNYLISYFLEPIENIVDLIPEYNLIKLSFIKACEVLNIEEEKEGEKERFQNGDITFENISYSYDDYHDLFSKLNLEIKMSNHIVLKGKSGCGKSTLCQLLNGNIKDYKGIIKIDGINIKDYSLKTLKSNILYVSQREELFNGSLEANIKLGKRIDKKELSEVLKITEIEDILDKKNTRLETIIYDGGFNFSGGERQRIILARSLLKKPKILILDESLNEVEKEREKRILDRLNTYLKDTTIIYISHNDNNFFNTVIRMDKRYE